MRQCVLESERAPSHTAALPPLVSCALAPRAVSLRFNDLDNIGFTGRHYSGFIMLGIQVFNRPGDFHFWSAECVQFNYRWLTEELGIDPEEITFIEDVWAGGGNLGPSIEYFVGGLELGNMVFMQYDEQHTHCAHTDTQQARMPVASTQSTVRPLARSPVWSCASLLCVSGIRRSLTARASLCRFR